VVKPEGQTPFGTRRCR